MSERYITPRVRFRSQRRVYLLAPTFRDGRIVGELELIEAAKRMTHAQQLRAFVELSRQ
jgi:hypothetical protein